MPDLLQTGQKGSITMNSINTFESNVYSEELYSFTEEEYAEVMSASAVEESAAEFAGYSEWSSEVETKFEVKDNKLCIDGKPFTTPKGERIGGIEI
jgi:hypothetical protein